MEQAPEMITTPQIRKVWYEAKQLKLSDEDVHGIIKDYFKVDSLKALTKDEAIYFIDELVKLSGNDKHRPGMATPMQLWKIEDLRKKLGWEPKGLKGYIKKYGHVEDARWLTDQAASSIITGLSNTLKGQRLKESEG